MDAALGIVQRDSLEGLSLRRVAREMGRAPMSLYRHVSDVEHLRGLVAERLIGDIDILDHGEDWRRTLSDGAFTMRDLFTVHPGLLSAIMRSAMLQPAMLSRVDVILGALRRAGLQPAEVVRAHSSLLSLVFGGAVLQRALEEAGRGAAGGAVHATFVDQLTASEDGVYANLDAVADAWMSLETDDPFRFAVDRLLDGIQARAGR